MARPNILFIMTDQQRFDTIAALGNNDLYTPNMDRLAARGVSFSRAYSPCPVCMAARYTIRTGCLPPSTGVFANGISPPEAGQGATIEARCGQYLPKVMAQRGYRTFGIGKFHTRPWNEPLGYEYHSHSEELYGSEQRQADGYAGFLAREHPQYAHIEQLMGERTEMYYMPQTSPFPAELGVESWAADRAVAQLGAADPRPFFGLVSFIGPHPPLAPPVPFNRLYNPERMPGPILGDLAVDHMDEQIPFMNHMIWAEDVDPLRARCCKARYYGELTYIDWCLGRILDAVNARPDADNTLLCFFSDHGEHMGDHHAWQKESFFEASARIPFLLSWPAQLAGGRRSDELVGLHDLFAIATSASGQVELREGVDVLGVLAGTAAGRDHLLGYYGGPGSAQFKIMVRQGDWKYIYLANGGREQLFNIASDPNELDQRANKAPAVRQRLRALAIASCARPGCTAALANGDLKSFPYAARPKKRIHQLATDRGVHGFPAQPADVLEPWLASRVVKA